MKEEAKASLRSRFATRFLIDETSGCWLWTGPRRGQNGYGRITTGKSTSLMAHRVSWEIYRGPIPEGRWVLHACDTPICVNPEHLFLGTAQDNSDDMVRKGRHRTNPVRGWANPQCRLTDGEWFLLCQLYVRGWSTRKLGALFAITAQSVQSRLRREGICRRRAA